MATNGTCCKCGSDDVYATHHEDKYACKYKTKRFDGEHLHKGCRNCQWEWKAEVLNKEKESSHGGE